VHRHREHNPLCTLELVAEGHAERCPGLDCPFWERECVLARVEDEIGGRPEVAGILLDVRRALEAGRPLTVAEARARLAGALAGTERVTEPLPKGAEPFL
jgi:hypothetical protein